MWDKELKGNNMSNFKTEATIESEFKEMLTAAKEYFKKYDQNEHLYHQCLVLRTIKERDITYPIFSDSIESLMDEYNSIVSELEKSENRIVKKIVCVWKEDIIDSPACQFLKALCALNTENKKTEILLNAGNNVYVTKKISEIIE